MCSKEHGSIPIIDVRFFEDDKWESIVQQVEEAFTTVGFAYLINHGISQEEITKVMSVSMKFFDLPLDVKSKYTGKEKGAGYLALGRQRIQKEVADLTEAFDTQPDNDMDYPDTEVPEFRQTMMDFIAKCRKLSIHVVRAIALSLRLEDKYALEKAHTDFGTPGTVNSSNLRTILYPKVLQGKGARPTNQMRCSEHTDWGTITLLFQDNSGGLQVMHRDGYYITATPIEGAVIVNIGGLLQRWTADKLVSAKHRVLMPDETNRHKNRQSIAYFVNPDDDVIVTPLDGSDKYPPITTKDYLAMKGSEIFY